MEGVGRRGVGVGWGPGLCSGWVGKGLRVQKVPERAEVG